VVGTGVLWDVSTLCAVAPPPGLYGVVGTGVLWDVSTLCAVAPPPGLYGVVGTGVLWAVSTLCAVVPPPGLYGVVGTGLLWAVSTLCAVVPAAASNDSSTEVRLLYTARIISCISGYMLTMSISTDFSRTSRSAVVRTYQARTAQKQTAVKSCESDEGLGTGDRNDPFKRTDYNPGEGNQRAS
jgi:hypothetical protein